MLARVVAGRRSRWLVIGAWIALAAALAPLQGKLQGEASNENEAFLSRSAESTVVNDLIDQRFPVGRGVNTVVAYTNPAGLTPEDTARIEADAEKLCGIPDVKGIHTPYSAHCAQSAGNLAPETPPSPLSDDGTTALVSVDTRDEATPRVVEDVAAIRKVVPVEDGSALRAYVTGEGGFVADAGNAFEGIDSTLLAITMGLVLVLLLAIYRSPVVALVPLAVVGVAYLVAAAAVYALVSAGSLTVTGQATAILIVLMFGAGTDYCLLLVSRYRDELRRSDHVETAMAAATARTAPTILSAGATVFAAMLVLSLADFRATRGMGPVLAIGVAITVLAALTLLPAVLAAAGRRSFKPRPPARVWRRIGELVRARPGTVAAVALAILVVGALGNLGGRGTLDFVENFRDEPGSARGQQLIADAFSPGRAAPLTLVADINVAASVGGALEASDAVEDTTQVNQSADGKLMLVDVTPARSPLSDEAADAVPQLRAIARRAAGGREALIGGLAAETHDSREAQRDDARRIVPLTLLLILLIVVALVRALVAPLYLVATVVLSYAFALGASSLVFTHLFGQGDSDPGLPLFAFIFLVALGVDYNIFLISRIREEHVPGRTRDAVVAGLERTGGVITSAGLILAGTFASLISIPVVGLMQMGFAIALGLLVDTFLIRIFLVPAIAMLLGERNWWPFRRAALLVIGVGLALAVAVPAKADAYVYWANSTPDERLPVPAIGRAKLDGTGVNQAFVPVAPLEGPTNPCGVAVDGRYVYWANATQPSGSGTTIGRARLDGSQADLAFITGADAPCGVAVDGRHLYWANYSGDTIGRANLDGTGVDEDWLPTGSGSGPCGVAVDAAHVYWANLGAGFSFSSVGRADIDGSDVEPDWVPAIAPCGVDATDTYVYWANFIQGYGSSIGRARIDGSDPQLDFIQAENGSCPAAPCLAGPVGVAVDAHHIYWANQTSNSIGRANIDGTHIDRAFVAGASAPVGVAVDDLPRPPASPPPPRVPASPPPTPAQPSPPATAVRLGRLRRDRRAGTATLAVRVGAAGRLVLSGSRIRTVVRQVKRAGTVRLGLRPRKAARRVLARRGRLAMTVRLRLKPAGGAPIRRHRKVVLMFRHRTDKRR